MARQNINLGTDPNDGEGDSLRSAFDKVNDNFLEIYTAGPVDSNISISNATISTTSTNANLELSPDGVGKIVIKNDLLPDAHNTRYIGSNVSRPRGAYIGSAGVISDGPIRLPVYADEQERDNTVTSPEEGMIIFVQSDSTSNPAFQGYNGSGWVDLS